MKNTTFKKPWLRKTVFAAALAGMIALPVAVAQANLMILPIRVVFKDRDRMQGITLVNSGNTEATYKLSFYYQKQIETGGYTKHDGPLSPECDMEKMLNYSPRQVSLPPGGKQTIRLSLRKPADQPNGECRIHMKMQREAEPERKAPATKTEEGKIVTQMSINVGFSIPVIMRQGKSDANATLSDITATRAAGTVKQDSVSLKINRTGKFSTMGNVRLLWTANGKNEEKEVGRLNDVNVYPESPHRLVNVALRENGLSGGKLRVVYEGVDADKGRTFDEQTINM